MKNSYKYFVSYYISLANKHPFILLLAYLIIAIIGFQVAISNIKIDTDLASLLPEDTDSVRALELSEDRIGAIDYFTIAIESKTGNRAAIIKLQDQLKERIEAEWPEATWVQIDRNTEFFRKHALYYLHKKDLLELKYCLEDELVSQSAKKMPGLVNLLDDDDSSDEKNLDNWYSEDIPKRMGLPSQVCRSFNDFFDEQKKQGSTSGTIRKIDKYSDRLISAEGDIGVVLVKLTEPSTNIDFAKIALERNKQLVASLNPTQIDPGIKVEVVGAYRKFMEIDAIARDGKTATIISVTLVLILLFLFFRSPKTIVIVFLPLIFSASLTMGIVALTYGRLTVLTIFILALLVGMGIDYSIHLFGRINQELRLGCDLQKAMFRSINETGRALLAAATTTVASMLVLLFGHFEGFREFGVVASFGLVACATSSILILPPLIFALQKTRPINYNDYAEEDKKAAETTGTSRLFKKVAAASFGLTIAVVAMLSVYAPDTQFEYDIRNIMSPATEIPIDFMRAIGKDSGTAPAIIIGEDLEQMREVHDYLLEKMVVEKDKDLKSFLTYFTFVPPMEEQLKRQKVIRQIRRILQKKALKDVDGQKGQLIEELTKMTNAQPFDHTNLPDWAKRIVTESNGDTGHIGHIYVEVDEYNVYSGQEFQDNYGRLNFKGKWVPIASSRFILSDVVRMVKSDGLRLLIIVSIVLLIILFIFSKKLKDTLILFSVMAIGGLWTAGIMGLLDIRISLYNIIVIPVILGVGIDGAIHLYHKFKSSDNINMASLLSTTGLTISISSITTMAGFMGLLFVEHKGLQTIGQLGTIGIATSWLAVMLLLPFLLPFAKKKITVPGWISSPFAKDTNN